VEIKFLSGQEAIENRLGTIMEKIRLRPDPLFSAETG
jgi:hypothetical protein